MTLATITLQNYFRMYEKLAGMTGTAATEANEFHKIYKLDVTPIPTNRPMVRQGRERLHLQDQGREVRRRRRGHRGAPRAGQPVLVGTISVEISEKLSGMLTRRASPQRAQRQEPRARGGDHPGRRPAGAVTIATNMAGRGVDIKLGDGRARISAASTSSAPSATSGGASTISCAAAPAARATRASRASSSPPRTT